MSATPFAEANAILAAQDDDAEEVARIVAGMYSSERDALEAACFKVIAAVRDAK